MLEIELKYPIADLGAFIPVLAVQGWQAVRTEEEVDAYFNAPDRDHAQSDEALRLRQIGPVNILTYKGPKLDAVSKTRRECEVRLQDGPEAATQMRELLTSLRYRFTAEVRKRRTIYHPASAGPYPLELCLDEVKSVGSFVELEILAPEADKKPALDLLQQKATQLGLGASERRSYLELLLAQPAARER